MILLICGFFSFMNWVLRIKQAVYAILSVYSMQISLELPRLSEFCAYDLTFFSVLYAFSRFLNKTCKKNTDKSGSVH